MKFISDIGKEAIALTRHTIDVLALFFNTVYWTVVGPFIGKASSRQSIFQQMVFFGGIERSELKKKTHNQSLNRTFKSSAP